MSHKSTSVVVVRSISIRSSHWDVVRVAINESLHALDLATSTDVVNLRVEGHVPVVGYRVLDLDTLGRKLVVILGLLSFPDRLFLSFLSSLITIKGVFFLSVEGGAIGLREGVLLV